MSTGTPAFFSSIARKRSSQCHPWQLSVLQSYQTTRARNWPGTWRYLAYPTKLMAWLAEMLVSSTELTKACPLHIMETWYNRLSKCIEDKHEIIFCGTHKTLIISSSFFYFFKKEGAVGRVKVILLLYHVLPSDGSSSCFWPLSSLSPQRHLMAKKMCKVGALVTRLICITNVFVRTLISCVINESWNRR